MKYMGQLVADQTVHIVCKIFTSKITHLRASVINMQYKEKRIIENI